MAIVDDAVVFVARASTGAAAAMKSPKLRTIHTHAWLMWCSIGFLLPVGTLLIRYRRAQSDPAKTVSKTRAKLFLYLHITVQCLAVIGSSTGISLLLHDIGGRWNYTHQRLGLSLWIIVLMQPFLGIARPGKGKESRPYWFVLHWVLGTGVVILGIVNVYIGIDAYQHIFQRSLRSLNIAFSIQVAFMAALYFLQDRWSYILGQRSSQSSQLPAVKASQTVGMSLDDKV